MNPGIDFNELEVLLPEPEKVGMNGFGDVLLFEEGGGDIILTSIGETEETPETKELPPPPLLPLLLETIGGGDIVDFDGDDIVS